MLGSIHTARRTYIHSGLTTKIQFLIYKINTISILIMANHTRTCVFIVFYVFNRFMKHHRNLGKAIVGDEEGKVENYFLSL